MKKGITTLHMKTTTINFPGLSLNEVCAQNPDLFRKSQTWYSDEAFANEKIPAGKWDVCLEAVSDSFSKTWEEQQSLIGKGQEVPPAAVLAYALVKHFKKTGERCLTDRWVRTSSRDSDGDRVRVGAFDAAGLSVDSDWDDDRYSGIGLAIAWKRKAGDLEDSGLEARVQRIEEVLKYHNLGLNQSNV